MMQAFFDSFLPFDLKIFEWVQSIQVPWLDTIMKYITQSGKWSLIFIALALILLLTKKHKKAGVTVLVALLIMELATNFIVKPVFARVRPFNLDPNVYSWWFDVYNFPDIVKMPKSFSFPSGHASSAFAAAFTLLWYDRKIGIPTTIFAALMAFSRIYVEVHYPTDVLFGILFGAIYAALAILVVWLLTPPAKKLIAKLSEKIKPKKAE